MSKIENLFAEASKARIGSAYAASWGHIFKPEAIQKVTFGTRSHQAGSGLVTPSTFFDLASLTKILATTSLYMIAHEAGAIDVNAPLETYLPDEVKAHPHLKGLTISQLLSHRSGLPAWRAYYEQMKIRFGSNLPYLSIDIRKSYFYDLVLSTALENKPDTTVVYSDVGFLILSYLAEKLWAKAAFRTFSLIVEEKVWSQISGSTFHFRPVTSDAVSARASVDALQEEMVATEICPWRGFLQGQVHDDNAWSMGGVAGHAGVFGTLHDTLRWIEAIFNHQVVSLKTLRYFAQEVLLAGAPSGRALGFDLPAKDGSGSTGFAFSAASIGHLGFTGTSLWMDLDEGFFAVLLTNRVHPSRHDLRIRTLRQNFHAGVRAEF